MLIALGKRLLKQWVCHPLANATKINKRLDAVESIMNDDSFREMFIQNLSKLPDLERMISRVHAGATKAADFVRVLEGFERIQTAINEIRKRGDGDGLIGQILAQMPDLEKLLQPWETAFDRDKVRTDGK
jgi:DNA mismatch repair protein MSH6